MTVRVTIPAAYLEDARSVIVASVREDAETLHAQGDPEDHPSCVLALQRDMRVMELVLAATGDAGLEGEQDEVSDPLSELLQDMMRLWAAKMNELSVYGPLPVADVLELVERLQWAGGEIARINPWLARQTTAVA